MYIVVHNMKYININVDKLTHYLLTNCIEFVMVMFIFAIIVK